MATPTRKKPRLSASPNSTSLPNELPSFNSLNNDELAHVLGFLPPEDIMRARLSIKLRDFATTLIVPPSDYRVRRFKVMEAMAKSLPNIQQITIDNLGFGQKYADGVDPNEDRVNYTIKGHITPDITILTRFKKLRVLELNDAPLNGRYAFLFKLPLLQKLTIVSMDCFKWDVFMLSGLLSLRELHCEGSCVEGNIKDLRALNDTLEKLNMHNCRGIEGDFMTLSDFRRLKILDLVGASGVIGDVREILTDDFQVLEELHLPNGVVGGKDHQFQLISEVADVMLALHRLQQRIPTISRDCYWELAAASPEWYDFDEYDQYPAPPFIISFVQAGPRVGWRWLSPSRPRIRLNRARMRVDTDTRSDRGGSCEVNWLDTAS